jgi:hypothetical protein
MVSLATSCARSMTWPRAEPINWLSTWVGGSQRPTTAPSEPATAAAISGFSWIIRWSCPGVRRV